METQKIATVQNKFKSTTILWLNYLKDNILSEEIVKNINLDMIIRIINNCSPDILIKPFINFSFNNDFNLWDSIWNEDIENIIKNVPQICSGTNFYIETLKPIVYANIDTIYNVISSLIKITIIYVHINRNPYFTIVDKVEKLHYESKFYENIDLEKYADMFKVQNILELYSIL